MKSNLRKLGLSVIALALTLSIASCAPPTAASTTTQSGAGTATTPAAAGTTAKVDENIIPSETVTLTVYSQLANYSGLQVGWFAKILQDKFNVKFNIIPDGDGVFATRAESGNLGDIIAFGSDSTDYISAVNGGLLLDWEADGLLEDYGPYILDNMGLALEKNRQISGTGKVYGFGHEVGANLDDYQAFLFYPEIRWDLYKQLGYPEVKTLEDFIPLLKSMVELEPNSDTGGKTFGVSLFPDWDGDMVMPVKLTAAMYGYEEFGFGLYNVKTKVWQDALDKNGEYLRALKFYNNLYQLGLLDPDSMTQTVNDASEDYQTGAAFFHIANFLGSGNYNTPENSAAGKMMYARVPDDSMALVYGLFPAGGDRPWAIGAKTSYPELCMTIINWIASPEGVMTKYYGPQGVTWDYGSNGKAYLTELGEKAVKDPTTPMPAEWGGGSFVDGAEKINNTTIARDSKNIDGNGETYNYLFWESTMAKDVSPIMQDWIDWSGGYVSVDEWLPAIGKYSIVQGSAYSATPKSTDLTTKWEAVKKAIVDGSWSAIYAKTDAEYDSIVADMIAKAEGYGYSECKAYQENEVTKRIEAEKKMRADFDASR